MQSKKQKNEDFQEKSDCQNHQNQENGSNSDLNDFF